MLQYLLNASAIWLLSLLLFDLLLRKETWHAYNRLYLLFTLLAGLLLPLLQWGNSSVIYHNPLSQPLYTTHSAIQQVAAKASITSILGSINYSLPLVFIYFTGVAVSFMMLLQELFLLRHYYKSGKPVKEQNIVVIETGRQHGPFSFLNYVFINSRQQYSQAEWQAILQHEAGHYRQLHIIDMALLQLLKIIFWFHPLVYIYRSRLLMVHEYEADKLQGGESEFYGKFLIEQAMLQTVPAIAHSFNRSPIKNRIMMLTKKSPRSHRAKFLIAVPLALCCMLCFTKSSYSYKRDKSGKIVTFKGNVFEFGVGKDKPMHLHRIDSNHFKIASSTPVSEINPHKENGETTFSITVFAAPEKVNGKPIYDVKNGLLLKNPVNNEKTLTDYLFYNLKSDFAALEDGAYTISISYPIIDNRGKLVYYENRGVGRYQNSKEIDAVIKTGIDKHIERLLDEAPAFLPTKENGKPVPSYDAWGFDLHYHIVVANHHVTLEKSEARRISAE